MSRSSSRDPEDPRLEDPVREPLDPGEEDDEDEDEGDEDELPAPPWLGDDEPLVPPKFEDDEALPPIADEELPVPAFPEEEEPDPDRFADDDGEEGEDDECVEDGVGTPCCESNDCPVPDGPAPLRDSETSKSGESARGPGSSGLVGFLAGSKPLAMKDLLLYAPTTPRFRLCSEGRR